MQRRKHTVMKSLGSCLRIAKGETVSGILLQRSCLRKQQGAIQFFPIDTPVTPKNDIQNPMATSLFNNFYCRYDNIHWGTQNYRMSAD